LMLVGMGYQTNYELKVGLLEVFVLVCKGE